MLSRRGTYSRHPDPVATTWALSFEQIEKANPAADLLRLCAFLAADAIPEELFAAVIPDALTLNDAIAEILKYSLLTRDPNARTVEIHRLVQGALKHGMTEEQQRLWAERAVRAVDRTFPNPDEFRLRPLCERLLPQAIASAELMERQNLELVEAAVLRNRAGYYMDVRGRYTEEEPLFQRALLFTSRCTDPTTGMWQ